MAYKAIGFVVWQGGKWYLRRRMSGTSRKLAVAGLAALAGTGLAVAQRQQDSD